MALDPATAIIKCRVDYLHCFKPFEGTLNQGNPKFKVTCIIDPSTPDGKAAMKAIDAAVKHVSLDKWKKHPLVWKDPKRFCVSDGNTHTDKDDEIKDAYKGMKVVSASNKNRPVIVDTDGRTPLAAEDNKPYSGCYAKVVVRFYGTENGGRGLFAGFEAIQFLKDGEPLSGGGSRVRAEDVFSDESDDAGEEDAA
jgi:hypothetical protein